jgi:transglutaminase-like putative cysteine protease
MTRTRILASLGPGWLALAVCASSLAAAPLQESWDSVFIAGARVGYVHATVEPFQDRGRDRLRVRVDLSLSFNRLGTMITTRMSSTTIETRAGAVESLDSRIFAGGQELRVSGTARNGKMTLTMQGPGPRQQQTLDWGPDVGGTYAVELSLARTPIKAGETRRLKMFLTDLNQVCDLTLTAARAPEETLLAPAGQAEARRSLLRVEQTTTLEGKPRPEFDMTLWVAQKGEVLKSSSESLGGMVSYRTTRQAALAPPDASAPFDQILNSIIKVSAPIARPGATRSATYRVSLKDADPTQVIPADRRQSLKPDGDGDRDGAKAKNTALLEVKTAGPDAGDPGPAQVDPVFLRPNAMIDSEDARIVELTRQAVAGHGAAADDPWEKVVRIEQWVAKNLKNKNFSVGFASASDVARNLTGDCTEHGVLTAAMCRAAGVPARVVVGLVYAESLGGFGYHLWNEVYVNRRWVAVDATFDQSSVDAVHIKLSDSSLDGLAPFEAFLPVVRVLGKMTLVPVETR